MIFESATLGLFTGTLLGLLGGGGSIVAVPILIYLLGLETKAAIGTSLVIVGIASLLAAVSHYRREQVLVRMALVFGMAGGASSFLGAMVGKNISDSVQILLFACAMALIAIGMLTHPHTNAVDTRAHHNIAKILAAGSGAGLLTGLLGVGGGFIIVPALAFVAKLSMKQAIGTSLLVIGINSLIAAVTYESYIRWNNTVAPFVAGTLAAAPIAGHFAHYIEQEKLKEGFAIMLLLLSSWMVAKQIFAF